MSSDDDKKQKINEAQKIVMIIGLILFFLVMATGVFLFIKNNKEIRKEPFMFLWFKPFFLKFNAILFGVVILFALLFFLLRNKK